MSRQKGTTYFSYLAGDFVFYRRLENDANTYNNYIWKRLWGVASRAYSGTLNLATDYKRYADYFYDLSYRELKKEKRILIDRFGYKDIEEYSYIDSKFAPQIIEAFNKVMGLKEVFERNLALILQTNGQRSLIVNFQTYFNYVWKGTRGSYSATNIIRDAMKKVKNPYENLDKLIEETKKIIDLHINDMVKEALVIMFKEAGAESGLDQTKYKNAYKQIGKALEKFTNNTTNEFIQSFIDVYQLNDIKDYINEQNVLDLKSIVVEGKYSKDESGRKTIEEQIPDKFNIKSSYYSKGGNAAEYFRTFMANAIKEKMIIRSDKYKAYAEGVHTGHYGIKPDEIFTIGVDTTVVENWLKKSKFGGRAGREANIKAAKQLYQKLIEFDKGYIIYTNTKNYTLNKNFQGYKAGEPISLFRLENIFDDVNKNENNLIRMAMQTPQGAIGDNNREEISQYFSQVIASALFDDFFTIGKAAPKGAGTIHLLDLNGILTPTSLYFWLLAQAFEAGSKDQIKKLIRVSMSKTKIKYPEPPEYDEQGRPYWGKERWVDQSLEARNNIKISYHFLKGFKEILGNLFENLN